jgi:uncharacterized membrane protein
MATTTKSRRWTVIGSGLLCGVLALVVIFTKPAAFHSPLAVVVVAAIGLAAVLLQVRLRNREVGQPIRTPVWLNVLGIAFAIAALLGDVLRLSRDMTESLALGAVGAFAISSALVLHAFRKDRIGSR